MSDLDASPVVLSAASLSANIGERLLIDDQEFILREGERVGLVGRNGAGKSSLLRILAGRDHFYSGEISCRKLLRCAYLPQAIELDDARTVRENILDGARATLEIVARYERHDPRMRQEEFEELERQIAARDGWNVETRMN